MKDLRDEIGFVPQKGVLFSGTIASNLRFGKDDASDEEIAKAAEIAQATEFIEAKDDKYETPIAQGGSNVSGGQKQRLAIARAILADNKILILVMKDGDIIEQEITKSCSRQMDSMQICITRSLRMLWHSRSVKIENRKSPFGISDWHIRTGSLMRDKLKKENVKKWCKVAQKM